ncbi:MAG: NUDIX domain-containing protein [Candidatus Paceibacterota bacterium]
MIKTPTIKPTIGLFAYLFDPCSGKLLVKRRGKDESLPGDWDLPGGGAEEEAVNAAKDERVIFQELLREIREELGDITIDTTQLGYMPAMHPAVISGGKDWAFGIAVGFILNPPGEGESWILVSPEELKELANRPIGDRLVSGPGKRMHRLCLCGLAEYSPSEEYRRDAWRRLRNIQDDWD